MAFTTPPDLLNDILNCNGSHYSISSIAHKVFGNKYVYIAKGNVWYIFNGIQWQRETGELRQDIQTILRNHYINALHSILQAELTTSSELHAKQCFKTIFKLLNRSFQSNIIKEMRYPFHKEKFLETLHHNLLAYITSLTRHDRKTYKEIMIMII
jgi:translation elongation factor EF-G